eukprot:879961-Pelagomonas_calceolata.AAC.4
MGHSEKDLDEVLQSTSVFHNVSKGVAAKDKDLQAAFGTTDHTAICLEILARGELQVSEEERKMQYEHLFKDVASVLVDNQGLETPEVNPGLNVSMATM